MSDSHRDPQDLCPDVVNSLMIECRKTQGYSVHCALSANVSWHLISRFINKNIYEILDKQWFKGYHCKSDMPLYK